MQYVKKHYLYAVLIPLILIPVLYVTAKPAYNTLKQVCEVVQFRFTHSKLDKPKLYSIPCEKEIVNVNNINNNYKKLDLKNLVIKIPWIKLRDINKENGINYYKFEGDKYIVAVDRGEQSVIYSLIDKYLPDYKYKTLKYFGNDVFYSEFELIKSVINISPKELKLFMSTSDFKFKSGLIDIEENYLPKEAENGIYTFTKKNMEGIQYGDPTEDDNKRIIVELFLDSTHKYTLMICSNNITKKEVDFILSSVQIKK